MEAGIKRVNQVVSEVIQSSTTEDRIAPGWVADKAFDRLDRRKASPIVIRLIAILYLRHIARSVLRGKFEPEEEGKGDQHELFPVLQARYPAARSKRSSEPVYVKLELLTNADVNVNIARLRSEARSKLEHADALKAWAQDHGLLAA